MGALIQSEYYKVEGIKNKLISTSLYDQSKTTEKTFPDLVNFYKQQSDEYETSAIRCYEKAEKFENFVSRYGIATNVKKIFAPKSSSSANRPAKIK